MRRLTRRDFLLTSGAVAAGAQWIGCNRSPSEAPPVSRGLTQLIELECGWLETTLGEHRVKLRAYNGSVPGPILSTTPGETLEINLTNSLTEYDSSAWAGDHNVPHHLDHTNLHLHGLEIVPHLFNPVGTSEPTAKMIAIGPGEQFKYEVKVPDDQPPGLFWYHSHHHGSTAVQAVSGMAGPLIVHGAIDEVPEIAVAQDYLLAIQDIGLFPSDDPAEDGLWTYNPKQNAIWDTFKGEVRYGTRDDPEWTDLNGGFTTGDYRLRYFLVNGQPFFKEVHNPDTPAAPIGTQLEAPTYVMAQGEVARFRMLNAASDNLMPIVVEDHEMHLIALDGVNFKAPRTLPVKPIDGQGGDGQVLLAPANRAEFLIKAIDRPGLYRIRQLAQDEQFLDSEAKTIATIQVTSETIDMPLPKELPEPKRHYPLIKESELEPGRRDVVFSAQFPGSLNPIIGMDLMVNGDLYAEDLVESDFMPKLETAEEWRLSVPDGDHGGNEGHPFHIHVNSFEVISIGGVEQPPGTIQDTVWVHKDSEVVVRMRFREWPGKSVLHCHILPHEDTGMMKNFLITE